MDRASFNYRLSQLIQETLVPAIRERCESLFLSGAIDVEQFKDDFALPKIIAHVALPDVANSISPLNDEYAKLAKNLRNF